jgi:hypothetical protein
VLATAAWSAAAGAAAGGWEERVGRFRGNFRRRRPAAGGRRRVVSGEWHDEPPSGGGGGSPPAGAAPGWAQPRWSAQWPPGDPLFRRVAPLVANGPGPGFSAEDGDCGGSGGAKQAGGRERRRPAPPPPLPPLRDQHQECGITADHHHRTGCRSSCIYGLGRLAAPRTALSLQRRPPAFRHFRVRTVTLAASAARQGAQQTAGAIYSAGAASRHGRRWCNLRPEKQGLYALICSVS